MAQYHPTDLFGGAMTVNLPSTFSDVSDIRQVPDHQEVWLEQEGFTSVVIEILERVEKSDDVEALKYHLHDIVEEDADNMTVWTSSRAHFARLPQGTPAYTLFATSPPGEKQRGRPNEPDFVGVLLTMIRLEEQKTDLLIAVNVPHTAGQYEGVDVDPASGKMGRLLEQGIAYREKILESFEIKDWGLFVQDE